MDSIWCKILIVVKTYPEISSKYTETVCVAGVRADNKKLIRIYPIRYRYLASEFRKYQWINVELSKPYADSRPESYNINPSSIEVLDEIPSWDERAGWVLNKENLFPSVEELFYAQKENRTSLGIVKVGNIKRVTLESKSDVEIKGQELRKNEILRQTDLFETKKDLDLLPVRIKLQFECENPDCKSHNMSILDWEFGQRIGD